LDLELKEAISRPRPSNRDRHVNENNASFPSGHAMGSTIGFGMLAYLLWRESGPRRWRWLGIGIATLAILLIGFSRIYLRAHYLTDVLGGYAAGLAYLAACLTALELARRRPIVEGQQP